MDIDHHLFATRAKKVPLDSLFEELPFVSVINDGLVQYCHYCFAWQETLDQCSSCHFARYCGEECQENAWFDHDEECKGLKKVHPKVPTSAARLMARLLVKLNERPEQLECNGNGDGKRTFGMLTSHADEIKKSKEDYRWFLGICEELRGFVDEKYLPPTADALLEVFGKLWINSFPMYTSVLRTHFGTGLFLELSVLDHSCDPKACLVMSGRTMKLNLIKFWEQENPDWKTLTISYDWKLKHREDRQKLLRENYYFSCTCSLCVGIFADYWERTRNSLRCRDPNCDGHMVEENGLWNQWWETCKLSTIWPVQPDGHCRKCDQHYSRITSGLTMSRGLGKNLEQTKETLADGKDLVEYMKYVIYAISYTSATLHRYNLHFNRLMAFGIDVLYSLAYKKPMEAIDPSFKSWLLANHGQYMEGLKIVLFTSFAPEIPAEHLKIAALLYFYGEWTEAKACLNQAATEAQVSHGKVHEIYEKIEFCEKLIEEARHSETPVKTDEGFAKIWKEVR